jgi:hypothetical protein
MCANATYAICYCHQDGKINLKYCPTEDVAVNTFTKALSGAYRQFATVVQLLHDLMTHQISLGHLL